MKWTKISTENKTQDEEDMLLDGLQVKNITSRSLPVWYKALLGMSIAANLLLTIVLAYKAGDASIQSQVLYSPAQTAIKYEVRKFHRGFNDDITLYQQEPSPAVDKAWHELYNDIGMIRIPEAEAKLLPNKTYPVLGDRGYYLGQLAVFHQLHCLNIIRVALRKDYYQKIYDPSEFEEHMGSYGMRHVSHCVDALREALECASDVSVVVWQWDDKNQKALGHGDIVHSCRNFDSIRNWSEKNKLTADFRPDVFIADTGKL